jgi:thiopurine S-methyltransferase
MNPQFWLEKWEAQQIGFHLDTVNPLLERHWPPEGLPQGGTVLVPLCGKSIDLAYLRRLGYGVVGIELSPLAVWQFFAEHGLEPAIRKLDGMDAFEAEGICLIRGDFFELRPEHLPSIDAVYDRAALIAMPPDLQPAYAAQLMALAPDPAPMLLITLEYDPREMQGPPFSTPPEQVERLYSGRYRIMKLDSGDALDGNAGLKERGLTALIETAWALLPKQGGLAR